MYRLIETDLIKWKDDPNRSPLLLRGARQVGKSYVLTEFATAYFKHVITINFEKEPQYVQCFTSLDPKEIIQKIAVYQDKPIRAGETFLFFDEIQACPTAIQSLRYFKEDMPELHVAGAGSLLEFALEKENFKMPVGRVQYLYLKPLSFKEFLLAQNKKNWLEAIETATLENPLPGILHTRLLQEINLYMMLGGMPAVVNCFLQEGAGERCQRMQTSILETYIDDFAKYASSAKQVHLQTVFNQLPSLIGHRTKYHKIDPDVHSRFLKEAIYLLEKSGVLYPVYACSAAGIPLNATLNFNRYKLFFLDVGLLTSKSGLSAKILLSDDILKINDGEIAEQFVCQELLAAQSYYQAPQLQYWAREQKQSLAEVDFVIQQEKNIVPIEVKAGSTGRLKSIQLMLQEKNLPLGIRISQLPLALDSNKPILSVPFYMISEINRLVA